VTSRRRLEVFALFLGWFLALGSLSRSIATAFSRVTYSRVTGALYSMERHFSDLEGRVVQHARGSARRDLLAKRFHELATTAALKRPEHVLWGAYDGGLPQTMEGFAKLERSL